MALPTTGELRGRDRRPPVDEVLARAMEAGPPSWRRRSVRRAAVLAFGGLLAVHVIGLLLDSPALVLAPVLLSIPVLGLLNLATRGMFELRPAVLDERMRAERLRFHEIAHRITVGVLLTMVMGVGVVAAASAPARLSFVMVEAGVIMVLMAPRLAGAWLLPEEPDAAPGHGATVDGPETVTGARRSWWRELQHTPSFADLLRADWSGSAGRRLLWITLACGLGGGLVGFMAALATGQ